MKNKGCWLSLIGVAAFFGLIVILVLTSATDDPVLSTTPPKPGFYKGGATHFMVSADGEISDFYLQAADTSMVYCVMTWTDEGAFLVDNQYHHQGDNQVDMLYAEDGIFYVDYSLTLCGQWRVSKAKSGHYVAEWISTTAPTP